MYVCICNAVTERDIHSAVAEGAASLDDLQERLRVSTCCGSCRDEAEACLDRCRGADARIAVARVTACA